MLDKWTAMARKHGASDLHLEPGMPLGLRIRGHLKTVGEPVGAEALLSAARKVIGPELWPDFLARRSYDGSRVLGGVRCRVNVLQSSRGVGLAVRLLASEVPTLARLNLHPELAELARARRGLVLVCGPTGAGKSSTLAALVEELNRSEARHVLTIEQPVEYHFRPRRAFIRQREVGRDTPSFEQALLDALREDPDVIVVGEMRRRETMQLTLDAAETGHLVLATVHASTCSEALQRLVSAFPGDAQPGVRAQLADCLTAVVCQTLAYLPEHRVRVPECEVLRATPAVRANIRDGGFFKLASAMETGAADGMWTLARYRRWVAEQRSFHLPDAATDEAPIPTLEPATRLPPLGGPRPAPAAPPGPAAGSAPEQDAWVIEDDSAIDDLIAKLRDGEP